VADDGARQIHDLLVSSNDTLAEAMKKIGDGLAIDDSDAEVGRAALQGISQAREYYGGLRRRIRRIHTSADAKRDVLDAISGLDDGLALFAKGLKADPDSDRGKQRISAGADRIQSAARDLNSATDALV
jgi:hypothetical protein